MTDAAVTPTCTATGLTEGKHCSVCSEVILAQEVVPIIDHIEGEWIVDKAATKTEDGSQHTECIMCHKVMQTQIIPATGSLGLAFKLKSDEASYSVTGIGTCTDAEVVIPAVYNGKPVTSIGKSAFFDCKNITSINIPNSVTSIGDSAFSGCIDLSSVTIGNGVKSIGTHAFIRCSNIESVYITDLEAWCKISFGNASANPLYYGTDLYLNNNLATELIIPEGITSVGDAAFSGCTSLTSIDIPDSVTSIGTNAFSNCTNLKSVTMPGSVTSIGANAFSYCKNLTSINIPNSVTSIGNFAFSSCTNLSSVTIGNGVTSIGGSAFQSSNNIKSVYITDIEAWCKISFSDYLSNPLYCATEFYLNNKLVTELIIPEDVTSIGDYAFHNYKNLTNVTMPDSVTSIGDYAFSDCTNLTSINIPNSVTSIGSLAFNECSSLTSINIPNSVTSIGSNAFKQCNNIKSVYITDLEAWCKISFRNYDSNPLCHCADLYLNNKLVKELIIPEGITSIGVAAFSGCASFSITIPNSVTSIGDYAFYYCKNLTNVTMPDSVTSIGQYAFGYCASLTSINIPNSVTSIGQDAFYGCIDLSSVTMGNGVKSIGTSAFNRCSNIKSVYITDLEAWCKMSFSGALANPL